MPLTRESPKNKMHSLPWLGTKEEASKHDMWNISQVAVLFYNRT